MRKSFARAATAGAGKSPGVWAYPCSKCSTALRKAVISTDDEEAEPLRRSGEITGYVRGHADSRSSTQGLSPESRFPSPVFCQVQPPWIHLLDQEDPFFATPTLDLLFPVYGLLHVLMALVVDQAMALVFLGKAFDRVVFVLMNALVDKAGDAGIKRAQSDWTGCRPRTCNRNRRARREM